MRYITIIVLLVIVMGYSLAHGAMVTIVKTGETQYTIQADALSEVYGLEIVLGYDPKSLDTPEITLGTLTAGAMMAANTTVAGSIRCNIMKPATFSGTGTVAVISFGHRLGAGGVSIVSFNAVDAAGLVPVQVVGQQQDTATVTTPTPLLSGTTTTSGEGKTPSVNPPRVPQGTVVTLQADAPLSGEIPRQDIPPSADTRQGEQEKRPSTAEKPGKDPQKTDEPVAMAKVEDTSSQYVVYKGGVERFRTYQGEKSLSIMSSLLLRGVTSWISQEPATALSDGKSAISFIVRLPETAASPNFAVSQARLVSIRKEVAKGWVVVAIPEQGAWKATLTISSGSDVFEFPFQVAPALPGGIRADEAGWAQFVASRAKGVTLQNDFNNDGVSDFIDEYIFAVNYLAGRQAPKSGVIEKTGNTPVNR